jgi:hypothetical protein
MPEMKIDTSLLDERFAPYFKSGERVEVVLEEGYGLNMGHGCRTGGRVVRFYVGKSTGWKPIYIMLLRRDSSGGMQILSEAVQHIRGLGIYKWSAYRRR